MARGLPLGSILKVELRLPPGDISWRSYFRGAADRIEHLDNRLLIHFHGENRDQGILISNPPQQIEVVEVELDGQSLSPGRQWWADADTKVLLPTANLKTTQWPKESEILLMGWIPQEIRVKKSTSINPEAEAALKAMGYVD